nr:MAG TPA: hypothetical protein [Caudoviricetes sp.]
MFGKSIDKTERTFYYIKCEIQRKPSVTCWNTSSTSSNNIVY